MFLKDIMFKTKFYINIYNVFIFNKVGENTIKTGSFEGSAESI